MVVRTATTSTPRASSGPSSGATSGPSASAASAADSRTVPLACEAGTSSGAGNQVSSTVPPGPAAPLTTVARPAPCAPAA